MTIEEIVEFGETQARKKEEEIRRANEELRLRRKHMRFNGGSQNFVMYERGHWLAVCNNLIVAHCDTEEEAYRELRAEEGF